MNRWKRSFKKGLNGEVVDRERVYCAALHPTHSCSGCCGCVLKSVLACRFEITVVSSIFEFPNFRVVNKSSKSPNLLPNHQYSPRKSVFPLIPCVCITCLFSRLLWVWVIDRTVLLIIWQKSCVLKCSPSSSMLSKVQLDRVSITHQLAVRSTGISYWCGRRSAESVVLDGGHSVRCFW